MSKSKTLDDIMSSINKSYGDNTMFIMGDSDFNVERIPSGILGLDIALGGGWPKGAIVESLGPEGSGKTSLALKAIAEAQRLELGQIVYIDAENSLNETMALNCGMDVDKVHIVQSGTGEQMLEICRDVLEAPELAMLVVDSVAALTPRAEIEGEVGDSLVGLHARMMSQALRQINNVMARTKSKATVMFINQLREKIGSFGPGPSTTTPGGRALRYWSSVRCEVTRTEMIRKANDDPYGHKLKVRVIKNRTHPPFKTVELNMLYDRGPSNGASILDLGIERGLIKQSGAWYADVETGEQLGQGRLAAIDNIETNDDLRVKLTDQILQA